MNHCLPASLSLSLCLSGAVLLPSRWHLLFLTPSLSCLTTAPSGTCTIKNSSPPEQRPEVHHLEQGDRPLAPAAEHPGSWGRGRGVWGGPSPALCSSHSISRESAAFQGPVAMMRVFRNNDGKREASAGGH